MAHQKLQSNDIRFLREAFNADYQTTNIRLREGEYQYDLAKAIAAFHLELFVPNVQDIIRKLYGRENADDLQFVRKIQTILKKMEKSDVVKILPKSRPWELQRYTISSFKFQDTDKNLVSFATDEEVYGALERLTSLATTQDITRVSYWKLLLASLVAISSSVLMLWSLLRPVSDPTLFTVAFSISVLGCIALGKTLPSRAT